MEISFNPLFWFICRLCRQSFPDTDKLKNHKIQSHLGDCVKVKCIVFEEKFLDHEWTPESQCYPDEDSEREVLLSIRKNEDNNFLSFNDKTIRSSHLSIIPSLSKDVNYSQKINPRRIGEAKKIRFRKKKRRINCVQRRSSSTFLKYRDEKDMPLTLKQNNVCDIDFNTENTNVDENSTRTVLLNQAVLFTPEKYENEETSIQFIQSESKFESKSQTPIIFQSPNLTEEPVHYEFALEAGKFLVSSSSMSPYLDDTEQFQFASPSIPPPTLHVTTSLPSESEINEISNIENEINCQFESYSLSLETDSADGLLNFNLAPSLSHMPSFEALTFAELELPVEESAVANNYLLLEQESEFERNPTDNGSIETETESKIETVTETVISNNNEPVKCKLCEAPFDSNSDLKSHLKECLLSSKNTHRYCQECDRIFARPAVLKHHILTQHAKTPRPTYKCKFCEKELLGKEAMKLHEDTHNLNPDEIPKPFHCTICTTGISFRTKTNLRQHIRSHSTHRPWECSQCSSAFKRRAELERHLIRHGKVTGYKCSFCNRSFYTPESLADHERIHTGDRPFKCQVPNCDKAFKMKQTLLKHKSVKHGKELGLQQFPCPDPDCGKAFGLQYLLKNHVRKYHSLDYEGVSSESDDSKSEFSDGVDTGVGFDDDRS